MSETLGAPRTPCSWPCWLYSAAGLFHELAAAVADDHRARGQADIAFYSPIKALLYYIGVRYGAWGPSSDLLKLLAPNLSLGRCVGGLPS